MTYKLINSCIILQLIRFLRLYEEEDNYFVACKVSSVLEELELLLAGNAEKSKNLQVLGRSLFSSAAKKLGWDINTNDSKKAI